MTLQPKFATENSRKIQLWIDFVCPYCLLGEVVIQEAIKGLDVNVEIMPFELRPYPTPTLRPEDDYLPSAWASGVYPTAEAMGVAIKLPTTSPQPYSKDAFLALQYASEHGRGSEFTYAVLQAFFQQDRDIGDREVLESLLEAVGVPSAALTEILMNPEYLRRHEQALDLARRVGIRAVPSIAVGGRLISGVPEARELRRLIIERLGASNTR